MNLANESRPAIQPCLLRSLVVGTSFYRSLISVTKLWSYDIPECRMNYPWSRLSEDISLRYLKNLLLKGFNPTCIASCTRVSCGLLLQISIHICVNYKMTSLPPNRSNPMCLYHCNYSLGLRAAPKIFASAQRGHLLCGNNQNESVLVHSSEGVLLCLCRPVSSRTIYHNYHGLQYR